jgi:hypothetical protein
VARSVATVEAKLLAVMANEIEHGAHRLADGAPEPAPKLLKEEGGTVGGTEEQERVDDGHVDALVEQIHGEHRVHAPCRKVGQRATTFVVGAARPYCRCRNPGSLEYLRHEASMPNAHAKPEGPHRTRIVYTSGKLREYVFGPDVVCGEQI